MVEDQMQREWPGLRSILESSSDAMKEIARLRAENEELKAEAEVGVVEVGVSEWRRQECLRLAAVNAELVAALEKIANGKWADYNGEKAVAICALAKARGE